MTQTASRQRIIEPSRNSLLRKDIPQGKFRIVRADVFDGDDFLEEDVSNKSVAIANARNLNDDRRDCTHDAYFVYNDRGETIYRPYDP